MNDDDHGRLNLPGVEFELETEPGKISHRHQYKLAYHQLQGVKAKMNEMLQKGYIQESFFAWNSPVLVVKKSDQSFRFIFDARG
eukprot:Pgem_evm1s17042